jgi:hypothetical protein
MTTEEAIAIANKAKPKPRVAMDKLQRGSAVAQFAADVAALSKGFDRMGGTVADMQKQIDRARAGVALCADVMKITINIGETLQ